MKFQISVKEESGKCQGCLICVLAMNYVAIRVPYSIALTSLSATEDILWFVHCSEPGDTPL